MALCRPLTYVAHVLSSAESARDHLRRRPSILLVLAPILFDREAKTAAEEKLPAALAGPPIKPANREIRQYSVSKLARKKGVTPSTTHPLYIPPALVSSRARSSLTTSKR